MSLNNEVEDLEGDDLEGSVVESLIFKEVFFGNDQNTNISNNENSATPSQLESCFAKEELKERSAIGCSSDRDANNTGTKAPTDEVSCTGLLPTSGPSKRIVPGISRPAQAAISDFITCRLVESSGEGVISSCFPVNLFAKKLAKQVVASKPVCSPPPLESSDLVASPTANVASNSLSCQSDMNLIVSSDCDKIPCAKEVLHKDTFNNPKSFLRDRVQDLLMDAGWEIGRRQRKKISGEFLYQPPWRGKPIREFRRVWNLCGRRLFINEKIVPQEDKKQWTEIDIFCADLYDTVMEMEKGMTGELGGVTLAQRWYLLDPFVNVVFVDKQLHTLKSLETVQSRRTIVMGNFEDGTLLPSDYRNVYKKQCKEELEDQPCDTSDVNESALTTFDTNEAVPQCGELSANKRSRLSMTHSKATYSTCEYSDGGLRHEDADIIPGDVETALPSHDCVRSSPSFDRHISDNGEDVDLGVEENEEVITDEAEKTFGGQMNKNVGHHYENSYTVNVKMKAMQDLTAMEPGDEQSFGVSPPMSIGSSSYRGVTIRKRLKKKMKSVSGNRVTTRSQSKQVPKSNEPGCDDIEKENIELEQTEPESYCVAANDCATESCCKSVMNSSCPRIGKKKKVKWEKFHRQNKRRHDLCQLKEDDTQFSGINESKSFRPSTKTYDCQTNFIKSKSQEKYKSKKGICMLVPRNLIEGINLKEGESSMLYVRTVLSWLVDLGAIALGETIQCRSRRDNTIVKSGLITRDGILCKCCRMLFSVSKFRSHAGFRSNNPYLDLYMKSGKSFTTCQFEAWSTEYKARESAAQPVNEYGLDPSDDKCGICGDMGELICCDNCPSTFHQACLDTQELPEGCWYCMHCSCRVCGDFVNNKALLKSRDALICLQCEQKYHRTCLEEKECKWVPSDDFFCCQSCQEVYRGLNSRIGFVDHLSDGFSWTLLKCIRTGDRKLHSAVDGVALEAACNTKLAVALVIMEESFSSIVDSRTGIDLVPHVLYNCRSEYSRLNCNGFHTVVLEKDDMLFSVASIRIHGVTVAEMPLVATCSKYEHQGMCRRLVHTVELLLTSLKVETLVVSAPPSLVHTWTIGFGFTLMDDNERNSLRDFNLLVFPGTVWLKKQIYGSPETLKGNLPSSITDIRAERSYSCKRSIVEYENHTFGRSTVNEAADEMEMRHMNSKSLLTDSEQHDNLYKHILKVPCGEQDSSTGRIRVDVGAARENVYRMSQKAHVTQDIC